VADIFISYARPDRLLAMHLASFLEAEGFTVWWDTSLLGGDDFRNVILDELGKARAAIVIWTKSSIASDWVISEAGRAHDARKLIPLRPPNLAPDTIPPPFDVLHTEVTGDFENIKAAVVSQLKKPAYTPPLLELLSKKTKYQIFTWVGIIGGALTLFTHLGAFLDLSDWASFIVTHWREWTAEFWRQVMAPFAIKVPKGLPPVLSFLAFTISVSVGARATRRAERTFTINDLGLIMVGVLLLSGIGLGSLWVVARFGNPATSFGGIIGTIFGFLAFSMLGMWWMLPFAAVFWFADGKEAVITSVALMFCFATVLLWPWIDPSDAVIVKIILIAIFVPFGFLVQALMLLIAPPQALRKRLVYLAACVFVLMFMNEVSKLGIDIRAPKANF
jgi:hypothetical protein